MARSNIENARTKDFMENIEDFSQKNDIYSHLNEHMKICEYRSRSFFDF